MRPAPELKISKWLNTETPLLLKNLKGKVVILHAFQMLCPGCVHYAVPQTSRLFDKFEDSDDVVVIGLHTVFEHHAAMGEEALKVFVHENRLKFPIGIDTPSADQGIPLTMAEYHLQGTPSLVLIDRAGKLRARHFGVLDDLDLGLAIGRLVSEKYEEEKLENVGEEL